MAGWEGHVCLAVIPQILITALCVRVINSERYYITSLHSSLALCGPQEARSTSWTRDERCTVSKPGSLCEWKLQIPVVSVPVGWQRLRNICGDRILCHSSLSLPPVTIEPERSVPANYHESWSTQWAFFRASSFSSKRTSNKGYVLRNRLTGGYLRRQSSKFAHLSNGKGATVNAWSKEPPADDPWWVDHDSSMRWGIVNHETGHRLEQSSVPLLEDSFQVECTSRVTDTRKTWVLVFVTAHHPAFFRRRHLTFPL